MSSTAFIRKFKIPVQLVDANNFQAWQVAAQTECFSAFNNTDMSSITPAFTLDPKFCKATFLNEWKEAAKDDNDPMEDPDFVQTCHDHALASGDGFKPWLPVVFAGVRASLSSQIAEQTNSVATGDLVALFLAITLAIGFVETTNPEALEILYASTTMELAGKNDIMTYISVLASLMRRLQTAGHPVTDAKACRVLLTGLHQDTFDSFISNAERSPHASYKLLVKALQAAASKPHILSKLRALKPGTSHSAMTTRSSPSQQQTGDQRMDRMEAILATLASATPASATPATQPVCFHFSKHGTCPKGTSCTYAHVTQDTASNNRRQRGGKYCAAHQVTTHNTEDCAMINANPQLKAFYEASRCTTSQQVTAFTASPLGVDSGNFGDHDPYFDFLV